MPMPTSAGVCRYLQMRIRGHRWLRRIDPDGTHGKYCRHTERIESLTQALQIVEGLTV